MSPRDKRLSEKRKEKGDRNLATSEPEHTYIKCYGARCTVIITIIIKSTLPFPHIFFRISHCDAYMTPSLPQTGSPLGGHTLGHAPDA